MNVYSLKVRNGAATVRRPLPYQGDEFFLPLLSTKIPRLGVQHPEHVTQVHKPLCNQVPYVALALPHAVDTKQLGSHQLLALLFH